MPEDKLLNRFSITASGALLFIVSIYIYRDLFLFLSEHIDSSLAVLSALAIEVALGAAAGIGLYYAVFMHLKDVLDMLNKMRVKDFVRAVESRITLGEGRARALEAVKRSPQRIVAVVDGEGVLRGVLSDYDLAVRAGERVEDVMTPDPVAVDVEDSLLQAYRLMRMTGLKKLPVYEKKDEKRVFKGFIHIQDILDALVRGM